MKDETSFRIVYELKQEISSLKRSIYDFKRRIERMETELKLGPLPAEEEWFPESLLNRHRGTEEEVDAVVEPVKLDPVKLDTPVVEPKVSTVLKGRTRKIINKYLKK